MSVELNIQRQVNDKTLPDDKQLQLWAETAVQQDDAEISLLIVDANESQRLNNEYRQLNKATNVLSFEMQLPEDMALPLQGDIVICADVLAKEAAEQNKTLHDHWAHIVIHGLLHLQGYDHIEEAEAQQMENLEITLLQQLGINNPYGTV